METYTVRTKYNGGPYETIGHNLDKFDALALINAVRKKRGFDAIMKKEEKQTLKIIAAIGFHIMPNPDGVKSYGLQLLSGNFMFITNDAADCLPENDADRVYIEIFDKPGECLDAGEILATDIIKAVELERVI